MKKLFLGVGINDANYVVQPTINGKRVWCPFYKTWSNMMIRGYSSKEKSRNLTYKDVTVCKEWHTFSVFKKWMEKQDWKGNDLDKDILFSGNKEYGPKFCIFIPSRINCIILDRKSCRGEFPLGVSWCKRDKKFIAQCTVKGKRRRLGGFNDQYSAHKAWQLEKINVIKKEADNYYVDIVKVALYEICKKIQYDYDLGVETIFSNHTKIAHQAITPYNDVYGNI